jgi:uncharacterized protein YoxC
VNAAKLKDEGAVGFVEKTAKLLKSDSRGVVKTVEVVLSKTNQLTEIGWH